MSTRNIGCLYLHGFLSSPQSAKAQQTLDFFRHHGMSPQIQIPALPFAPQDAAVVAQTALQQLQQRCEQVFIIGSSLGGFYATWLARTQGVKAVLVNPAVRPFDLFEHYLGPNTHFYTGEVHELTYAHIAQLKAMHIERIENPQNLLLLLQTGDETLDYRLAADYYRACPSWLEGGGNHSFSHFAARLPMLLHWAERTEPTP